MPHIIVAEGLPKPLERALRSAVFEYSKERDKFLSRFEYDYEFSVTDLWQAPKQLWLKRKFRNDIVIDLVRDNYFSLLGNIVHHILEHYAPPECIVEERQHTFFTIGGKRILFHGKPDCYDPDPSLLMLDNYKFVSPWAVLFEKKEYEFQLNMEKYLIECRGLRVERIRNIYLFRELRELDQLKNPDYPKENIQPREFTPWLRAKTEANIKGAIVRLMKHADTPWKKLPDCTDEERWIRETTWGVYHKVKAKSENRWSTKATKRFDNESEANTFGHDSQEDFQVLKKAGEPKKCLKYCPVATFCEQWQKELRGEHLRKQSKVLEG